MYFFHGLELKKSFVMQVIHGKKKRANDHVKSGKRIFLGKKLKTY